MVSADSGAVLTQEDVEGALRILRTQMETTGKAITLYKDRDQSFGSPVTRSNTMASDLNDAFKIIQELTDKFTIKNPEETSEADFQYSPKI